MPEQLTPLSRYDYVGPYADNPAVVGGVDHHFRTFTDEVLAQESPKGPELIAQSRAMSAAVEELGRDLGLDLSDRVRGADYTHLYTKDEYARVRSQFGLVAGSLAVHSTTGHIFASEESTLLVTLSNANHELVHVMSRKSIRPQVDQDGKIYAPRSHDGYASFQHDTFRGLNELFTEVTNIDLMRNYWPRHPELADIAKETYRDAGYVPGLIFFDELFKAQFEDPLSAFKPMQKGMFTGEMGALRAITDVVGTEAMHKIAETLDGDSIEGVLSLARELGLTEAVRKIETRDATNLLLWL